MSASLLLPCASPPYNSSNIAPSLNRGGSNGLLSSCSSCQGTGKTPLLKARRLSPQPLVVPGTHNNQNSPNQELDILNSSGTSVCQDYLGYSQNILPSESHQVNKRGSGDYCMVDGFPPVEILSSQESKFNLRTPTSSDIPFFGCRKIESVSPDNQVPSVHQSKPALIMPSLFSFLKSDPTPKTQLPRNPSSRSLNNPSSPSPLIRKCNTMVALSDSGNSSAQSTTTKLVKERKSRLSFLRCVSSSPSNSTSGLKQSPSTSQVMQWRKRSSGVWPREPLEGKDGADVPEPITPPKGILKSPSASFGVTPPKGFFASQTLYCKLCLSDVSYSDARELEDCQCKFCTYCLRLYSSLKIRDGEFRIECPDAKCKRRGALNLKELHSLVGSELMELHDKYRRLRDVEMDPYSTWCPKAGCETVVPLSISKFDGRPHCSVCATCKTVFCASCSEDWHPGKKCTGPGGSLGVPLNDTIKRCPSCKVPIERDAGCAQMQCKKCKHVFCWYCLASLEDDFLLRHYDKGPCKNKLGHSRASVLWHRAQVVVIFAGFGLLLVFASPLLLLVGPCLLCRGCRQCPSDDSSSSSGRSDSSFSGDSDYD